MHYAVILQPAGVERGKVLTGEPDLWVVILQGIKLV